jgi:hypothetical protein
VSLRRWLVAALVGGWVLTSAGLAAVRWPRFWEYLASEQTPMTWLQSVVLVLAGAAALLVALLATRRPVGRPVVWALLATGFVALALDERFAVHERVRDGYLAPRDVRVPFLPWVGAGDFLVLLLALVGLALLPAVWRLVRTDRWSRSSLLVGVGLAVVAVGVDSVDPATWTVAAERVQQSLEEVVELASALALLGAVVLRLVTVLEELLAEADPPAVHSAEPVRDGVGATA